MQQLVGLYYKISDLVLGNLQKLDFIAPLLLRIYLVPVFWMAGSKKIDFSTMMPYESTVAWFGNPDWGLGLPLPTLMAFLAGWTEVLGAIFLAAGLAVRWITIPLLFTMLVAAVSVHLDYGWQAISDAGAPYANERVVEAADRLDRAKDILREHGNYEWLTEHGSIVILNNGIEFAATYFLMLLALLFMGGGAYLSVDYWAARMLRRPN